MFGEWLSLVEHLVRDQGVGGSNPLSPTNVFNSLKTSVSDPFGSAQVLEWWKVRLIRVFVESVDAAIGTKFSMVR